MSEPRMMPADEAQALQGAATKGPWAIDPDGDVIKPHSYDAEFSVYICSPEDGNRELVAAAPDLAHTVVEQAAQIERVREVLAWAEQAENRAHADWIATADTHHRDAALAYTQAARWARYALGDNDD